MFSKLHFRQVKLNENLLLLALVARMMEMGIMSAIYFMCFLVVFICVNRCACHSDFVRCKRKVCLRFVSSICRTVDKDSTADIRTNFVSLVSRYFRVC